MNRLIGANRAHVCLTEIERPTTRKKVDSIWTIPKSKFYISVISIAAPTKTLSEDSSFKLHNLSENFFVRGATDEAMAGVASLRVQVIFQVHGLNLEIR